MTERDHHQLELPTGPGVYFFKRNDHILYIGKASNLRTRTGSYFTPRLMETRGPLIVAMVEEADTLDFQSTDSALEALLLESRLIKRHQPPYNSKEKDNKSYNYVVITQEELPRVFAVRGRELEFLKGQRVRFKKVFGPFPQGNLLREALRILRKIFPFYGKQGRAGYAQEFYKQLALVPGVNSADARERYLENLGLLEQFFLGKKRSIIQSLKKKMGIHASRLEFEQAQVVKLQIGALEHIRDISLLKRDFDIGTEHRDFRIEGYDISHHRGAAMQGVMVVYQGGELDSNEYRNFTVQSLSEESHDPKALYEVVSRRLRHPQWRFPDLIVVDGGIIQKRFVERAVRESGAVIPTVAVVKDDRHRAREIIGQKKLIERYQDQILKVNAESHRFAISLHRKKSAKNFITKKL